MFHWINWMRESLNTFGQHPRVKKILPYWPIASLVLTFLFAYLCFYRVLSYPFNLFGDSFLLRPTVHQFCSDFLTNLLRLYYRIFSGTPGSARFLNLTVHLLNGFAVFLLARQFGKKMGDKFFIPALLATLFFLFSPLVIENIVWISTIKETLATTGVLFSLLLYAYYIEGGRRLFLVLAFMLQILITLVQPAILVLPFLFFLYSKTFEDKKNSDLLLLLFPALFIPLLYFNFDSDFAFWFAALKRPGLGFEQGLLARFIFIGFYLLSIFVPGERKLDYGWELTQLGNRPNDWLYVLFASILIISLLVFIFKKNWRIYLFFLVAFSLALIFDLRFLALRYEAYPNAAADVVIRSYVADRYLYLPLALFFSFLFPLLIKIEKFKKISISLVGILIVILFVGFTTQKEQMSFWQRNASLIKYTYDLKKFGYEPLVRIGRSLENSGEVLYSNSFFEEAHLRAPEQSLPVERLIKYYNFYKDFDRAEFLFFQRLSEGKVLSIQSYLDMSEVFQTRGDILLAEKVILIGLKNFPDNKILFDRMTRIWNRKREMQRDALETLGHYASFNGEFEKAKKFLIKSYHLDPSNTRVKEAAQIYRDAFEAKQVDNLKKKQVTQPQKKDK